MAGIVAGGLVEDALDPTSLDANRHGQLSLSQIRHVYSVGIGSWALNAMFIAAPVNDKSDTLILNDPGITLGHGYHIKFDQLTFAINTSTRRTQTSTRGRSSWCWRPRRPRDCQRAEGVASPRAARIRKLRNAAVGAADRHLTSWFASWPPSRLTPGS